MHQHLIKTLLVCLLLTIVTACSSQRTVGEKIDDAVITSKVEAKLAADPEVSSFKVDVDTVDGVVRLSGVVEKRRARREAADLARHTNGVRKVVNDITIGKLSSGERLTDASLTVKITTKFAADPEVNPFKIDVDTDNAITTLTGTVKTQAVKQEAEDLALSVEGVKKVRNLLKVEHH